MAKKKMNGIIYKLFRNYGFIKSSEGKILPFEFTKEMIICDKEGNQFIRTSKDVGFRQKQINLRNKEIYIATDIDFLGTLDYSPRKNSKSYLDKIREKFSKYNILTPCSEQMVEEFKSDTIIELEEFHKDILQTEDDILYEWLKFKGFQPYMLDYLINELFEDVDNKTSDRISDYQTFSVDDIVKIDLIDKRFRGQLLKLVLGVENSYKSLISRIAKQEEGGFEIANKILVYWSNNEDSYKQKQYKRAKDRYKFLTYSDDYDYILGSPSITIDDLMDQLDLSNLENLLVKFNEFQRERLSDGTKFFSPWVYDIVRYRTLLRCLNSIRNAGAHDRPILPLIMNKEQNPNLLLDLDESINTGEIKGWKLFTISNRILIDSGCKADSAIEYLNEIYGNLYRRAWFELNIIYQRFIPLFDSKVYENYETIISEVNENIQNLNNIPNSNSKNLLSISETLLNDYKLSKLVAEELTNILSEEIPHFATEALGKNKEL